MSGFRQTGTIDDDREIITARGLTRRDLLKWCGAAGLGALAGASWGEAARPAAPNIVFVFADQQRNASWPGGGDPQVKTPNLERLAREGAVFNHCISTYPLCSPYRASMLTGRYPQATTITFNVPQAEKIVYDAGEARESGDLKAMLAKIVEALERAGKNGDLDADAALDAKQPVERAQLEAAKPAPDKGKLQKYLSGAKEALENLKGVGEAAKTIAGWIGTAAGLLL